jgi:pantoate--beta-alanine ligase
MPVEIVACPTVRDADGLALSSRNAYLKPEDRTKALALIRALRTIEQEYQGGERDARKLEARGREVLEAAGLDGIDYFQVVDPETLQPLQRVHSTALVCGAVRVGTTRLIDNLVMGESR